MANTPLGFPFGFYVADNSPIDGKYGILDAGVWRPYLNTAEALAEIPIGIRYIGLTVNINKTEYWWAEGVTNAHLVAKHTGGVGGIAWKNPVRAATTANIALSGLQTIDGVSLIADDRVLVKDQATQSENGIYVTASGSWTRAIDADSGADLQNAVVSVDEGAANADTTWRQSADGVSVNSTAIVWMAFGSAGITGSTGPADNAIIRADGTDGSTVQPAPAMLDDSGNLVLGTSSLAGDRTISAASSAASASLTLQPQGQGTVNIKAGNESSILTIRRADSTPVLVMGQNVMTLGSNSGSTPFLISTISGGATHFKPLTIMTGNSATTVDSGELALRTGSTVSTAVSGNIIIATGATTHASSISSHSGHVYIDTGAVTSPNALEGSIGLFTQNGSFGGGEKVLFMANASTVPSTAVTGGGVMFVKPGDSKPYWWTGTSEFSMTASGIAGSTGPIDNALLRADGTGGGTLQNSSATITDGGKLQLSLDDASANTVIHGQRITRTTEGTPAIGIGTGLEFEVETSAGNNEIVGTIEAVVTSVTPGLEYADLVFKGMLAGSLTELFRITAAGSGSPPATRLNIQNRSIDFLSNGITVNSDTRINASMKIGITEGSTIERKLHVQDHHVINNTVLYPLRLTRACQSSNGAIGVGTGMEFETETGGGTNRVGSTIESVASVVTNGSENFDLIFKTMGGGTAAAERVRINSSGLGIGLAPTAKLTLAAGTAAANTAPLKFTSGTALTTPEDGALEYHSSHLFFTIGSTRFQLDQQGGLSGLTANRIPYATGPSSLADDTALTWDAANNAMTVGSARFHTTGTASVFIGQLAGNFTTTSVNSIGIGQNAVDAITNGAHNIGIGQDALSSVTTGSFNIAIGGQSQSDHTNGSNNTSVGFGALDQTSGSNNTCFGYRAGSLISSGNTNIAIGYDAGINLTTGANNIIIGNVNAQSATASNQLSIQNIIFGTGNSATGTSVSAGNIGIAVTAPTARLHLPAGTATANTAPLKLTSGTALTTPENGALEYHSSHLYFTIGSTRYQLDQQATLTSTAAVNEIPKSNGTSLVSTGLFSSGTTGQLDLGSTSTIGQIRDISAKSSGASAAIRLLPQGPAGLVIAQFENTAGYMNIAKTADAGTNDVVDILRIERHSSGTTAAGFGVVTRTFLDRDDGSSVSASQFTTRWANAAVNSPKAYVLQEAMNSIVSPVYSYDSGNFALLSAAGAFGAGSRVLFMPSALTLPSTSVAGGGVMYVKAADGKPYWWTGTSEFPMTGGGGISGLTANRIPYASGATSLADSSALLWDNTNQAITIGTSRIHSSASDNFFAGDGAGNFTSTGTGRNIGIGTNTLDAITSGAANIAIGWEVLTNNQTGVSNVGIGSGALIAVTGNSNIGIGASAGQSITSGAGNITIGSSSGDNITTGTDNIVIGRNIDAQSATDNNQLSIQNIIFGTGNLATGTTIATGSIGIGVVPTANYKFGVNGDISIVNAANAFYLGEPTTNGTWRIMQSGDNLVFQQREAGTYVTKSTISGA